MRRRAMETAGMPASTFFPAAFQSTQNLRRSPYSQNATLFLFSRRKSAKTAGTPASTFSLADIQSAQNHPPRPILAERHAYPLFAEKKRENSRNAQRFPRIVPIRAEPPPLPVLAERPAYPLFAEKSAKTAGTPASTFSLADIQSVQNHPPLPATALSDLP